MLDKVGRFSPIMVLQMVASMSFSIMITPSLDLRSDDRVYIYFNMREREVEERTTQQTQLPKLYCNLGQSLPHIHEATL